MQPPTTRALRHYLESLARAGVSHMPVGVAPEPTLAESRVESDASIGEPPWPVEPTASRSTGETSPVVDPSVGSPTRTPAKGAVVPAASGTDAGSPSDRLEVVAKCVADCTRCTELAETRTQTVFGVGDPEARILFIGEAPGADEDRTGEPFVGRAGQLLTKIIEACHLKREDVYICNILKCRPPGNRNPTDTEADNCREYLDAQIATVQPEYIVCWGSIAAKNLLDTKSPIGRLRGRFHEHGEAKVLCTYHPSYLLRNPAAKKDVWEDMKFLFADMGVEL